MNDIKEHIDDNTRFSELMSRDQLIIIKEAFIDEIGGIKSQIEEAQANVRTSGEYSDPHWYRRANAALRIKQSCLQKLNRIIGSKKKNGKTVADYFMDLAQATLNPEIFDELLDDAKEMKDGERDETE